MRINYIGMAPHPANGNNHGLSGDITTQSSANPITPIKRGRGRPKGAVSGSLSAVRQQAAEEKRKLREELTSKVETLRQQWEQLEQKYQEDVQDLQEALRLSEQRESFYRTALEDRLRLVAEHIHKSLTDWADAELTEGQITQRKRGRPRKTFK